MTSIYESFSIQYERAPHFKSRTITPLGLVKKFTIYIKIFDTDEGDVMLEILRFHLTV